MLALILSFSTCAGLPAWACDAQLKTGINPYILYAVCTVESMGRVAAYTPRDGDGTPSIGVCQLKLNTARHMGFKGTEKDLIKPTINAIYAAKYLIWQFNRYGTVEQAVSAYNVGHASQNHSYVSKVMMIYNQAKELE